MFENKFMVTFGQAVIDSYGAATEPVVTDMRMTNPAVSILRVFKLALRFFC